ncbi:hypothetical protein SEA_ASCELA_49 [Arthrobacter phage Ascela]|uniref:DUF4352 domain-containing protein n=1 Tax=Arthrobacter phage Ascela TaxID=3038360 RepID=A0AAF0GNS4_9CAUD|nr:hypothetical protein SEA_ASCELA_49 [Arthrobacter phage Ascela]
MKRTLALAAALALAPLTACGASSNTITPGETAEAAAPTTATTQAPAPEPATTPFLAPAPAPTLAAEKTPGFGDTVTFPSGVAVKLGKPVIVTAEATAYGAIGGKIVAFELVVTNKSPKPIEGVLLAHPQVRYGAKGIQADPAVDFRAGLGGASLQTILPGETQSVKLGYGIPPASFGDVRVEVSGPEYTDSPAIFKGAVK